MHACRTLDCGRQRHTLLPLAGGLGLLVAAYARGGDAPRDAAPVPAPITGQQSMHWPIFRGASGQGIAGATPLPSFDATREQGLRWKTPIPLPGMSSPVVWDDRIFITGANRDTRKVFCFHTGDGQLLWSARIETQDSAPPPNVMEDYTGFAAPTAATDGRAVYALFANGDVAAVDHGGEIIWVRSLGPLDNTYGHASSLLVRDGELIVLLDQGHSSKGLSRLLFLDCRTGHTIRSITRPVSESWASPVIVKTANGDQLVTAASPFVIAYEPSTGAEIWRAGALRGDVTFSPVFAGGLVFSASPDMTLFAIRPDGSGDVTSTHIAWQSDHGVPDIASPVTDGHRILMATTNGRLTLHDVSTGALLWDAYLDGEECYGSPIIAGGLFYVLSREGRLYAVDPNHEPRTRQVGELGERTYSSPALANGMLFIRGTRHLYGIGNADAKGVE